MELLHDILLSLIKISITTTLPLLTSYIISLIKAKMEQINLQTKNEKLKHHLSELASTIEASVALTSQIYVDALKSSDKFDKEAQSIALLKAKEYVLATLTPDAKEFLLKNYTNSQTLLEAHIEREVRLQKHAATSQK